MGEKIKDVWGRPVEKGFYWSRRDDVPAPHRVRLCYIDETESGDLGTYDHLGNSTPLDASTEYIKAFPNEVTAQSEDLRKTADFFESKLVAQDQEPVYRRPLLRQPLRPHTPL